MKKLLKDAGSLLRVLPPAIAPLRESLQIRGLRSSRSSSRAKRRLAVQLVEDRYYFALFTEISKRLGQGLQQRTREELEAELIVVRSVSGAIGFDALSTLKRSSLVAYLATQSWVRAYGDAVQGVGYRSRPVARAHEELADARESARLWRSIQGREDISDLQIGSLTVGDLVMDSYLRFRPSPRFRADDPFVLSILLQAHRDVRRAQAYFGARDRPSLYLTTYTTYVEHGVAVRAALQAGVPTWSFGNLLQIGKKLSVDDAMHTPDSRFYRQTFAQLDDRAARLAIACDQLERRLSGQIDTATSYMKVSAYAQTNAEAPDVRGAVIVFLHDFYDSPHVYHDLVFPDFWAWVCCTIETLRAANIPFFLKPHPNQISLGAQVLRDLSDAYPGLSFIPSAVTNRQLVDAGMLCGVTVYGTVAHELAYLGVPTIACARHPHVAFDFCRTARTKDEYQDLLRRAGEAASGSMREQALEFYYMHNLNGSPEEVDAKHKLVAFRALCSSPSASDAELTASFDAVRHSAGFERFIQRLLADIESHS
jgi:hypothetical protein